MDFKSRNLLIIFSISCLLLLSSTAAHCVRKDKKPPSSSKTSTVDPALTKLCDQTSNKDLCVSTVAPFLHGKAADPISAIEVMIKACLNKTRLALEQAKKLPKGHGSSDVCAQVYDSAISELESIPAALAQHDYFTANIKVSAVLTYAVTCDDAYGEEARADEMEMETTSTSGSSNPMAEIDKEVRNLASNILAATKLLK